MDSIPSFSSDLIKALDAEYPERCPEPSMSDRDIWMMAGQRKLVRRLLRMIEDSIENDSEVTTVVVR